MVTKVGKPDPHRGETVLAIFRTERETAPFLVCTTSWRDGNFVLAHTGQGTRAIEFEVVEKLAE